MEDETDKNDPKYFDDPELEDGEKPILFIERIKHCFSMSWRGWVAAVTPLILLFIVLPPPTPGYAWCGYTLLLMAVYWVTECVPLPVTSFLPILIFPLTGVMNAKDTCKCYFNDTIMMFLGSLMLAAAVEQCGMHHRLALATVRTIGYSHYRLLFAMCFVTMFVSMWITNTAATTMMVPINFALLKVFEDRGLLKMYDTDNEGNKFASDLTTCYFCAATYSATVGGIGTLVGTGTNLVFRGLFQTQFPEAPDYLSFVYFSAFAVPYMIIMEIFVYLWLIFKYFGFLRPNSAVAKSATITEEGISAAKQEVQEKWEKLGPMTFWEYGVIILFLAAILLFFSRSPQIFPGWADRIIQYYELPRKYIGDSACAFLICFLLMIIPYNLSIFKHCTSKDPTEAPHQPIRALLDWTTMNGALPYSFTFLLGGGFCLSTAASKKYTDLNSRIGDFLQSMETLPNPAIVLILIIFTVFVTNLASNVAVTNVIGPIAMTLAQTVKQNPLMYIVVTGFCASYTYLLPVGTPGNLIVQSAASIPTSKMIVAGSMPTLTTILITFAACMLWAPVVWPDITIIVPSWVVFLDVKKDEKTPYKGGAGGRLKSLAVNHFRGILGFILLISINCVTGSRVKPSTTVYCLWITMFWFFLLQPVSIPVTGMIPVFYLPMLGIMDSNTVCKFYYGPGQALFMLAGMVGMLLNNSKFDRRVMFWIMNPNQPVTPIWFLTKASAAAYILSVFSNKLLVSSYMMEILAPAFNDYDSDDVRKFRNIIMNAIQTSASIGGMGIIHGSLTTLAMKTIYEEIEKATIFNYYNYSSIFFLTLSIYAANYVYHIVLIKVYLKSVRSSIQSSIKNALNKAKNELPPKITAHEIQTVVFLALAILMFFTRVTRFGGWGGRFGGAPDDLVVGALFVILLSVLPKGCSMVKVFSAKTKSQMPPCKPESGMMFWKFVDKNTIYGYLFLIGGGNALAGAVDQFIGSSVANSVGKIITSGGYTLSILMICFMTVVLVNIMSGVAAVCVLLPYVVSSFKYSGLTFYSSSAALTVGLASSLGFAWPFKYTCAYFVHKVGKVPLRQMSVLGIGSAFVCMLPLMNYMMFVG